MTFQQRIDATTPVPIKLTASDFWLLAGAGAFQNYARSELIEGEIFVVNSVWRWHARVNFQFGIALKDALEAAGIDMLVYGPGSVAMSDDSVPEPDLSVALPEPTADAPISLSAVRIAIELSDTTRSFDLGRKMRLYARHGVPEYWVADRERQQLVVHAQPTAEGYASVVPVAFGTRVASATLDGLTVETRSLLD